MNKMKTILLIRNLHTLEQVEQIDQALSETRVIYEIDFQRKCVIVLGNQDMAAVARKTLAEIGFMIV